MVFTRTKKKINFLFLSFEIITDTFCHGHFFLKHVKGSLLKSRALFQKKSRAYQKFSREKKSPRCSPPPQTHTHTHTHTHSPLILRPWAGGGCLFLVVCSSTLVLSICVGPYALLKSDNLYFSGLVTIIITLAFHKTLLILMLFFF